MRDQGSVLELETIRKNRGITLEQIASVTKIGVRTLEAIERGEFRKLPGGIYDTSYIRQYARAIDYDEDVILTEYRRTRALTNVAEPQRGLFASFRTALPI